MYSVVRVANSDLLKLAPDAVSRGPMMVITVLITPQLNMVPSLAIRTQCCGTYVETILISFLSFVS